MIAYTEYSQLPNAFKRKIICKILRRRGWREQDRSGTSHLSFKAPNGKLFTLKYDKTEIPMPVLKDQLRRIGYDLLVLLKEPIKVRTEVRDDYVITEEENITKEESFMTAAVVDRNLKPEEMVSKAMRNVTVSQALDKLNMNIGRNKNVASYKDTVLYIIAEFLVIMPEEASKYRTIGALSKGIASVYSNVKYQTVRSSLLAHPWNLPETVIRRPYQRRSEVEHSTFKEIVIENRKAEIVYVNKLKPLVKTNELLNTTDLLFEVVKEPNLINLARKIKALVHELFQEERDKISKLLNEAGKE